MTSSIALLNQIQDEVVRRLREDLSFEPLEDDPVRRIDPDNITVRKVADLEKPIDTPAIIVTGGRQVAVPPSGGTNERDDYPFSVVIQIIDNDSGDQYQNRATYQEWGEKIARAFNQQTLSGIPDVYIGLATQINYLDPKIMQRHRQFVGGVVGVFIARLTRGVT